LLGKLGIPHHLIPYPATIDEDFKRIYRTNNASANDAYCSDAQALHGVYPDSRVCVTGDAAEVVKCHFRRTRPAHEPVDANELAGMAGLGSHRFVIAAFGDWLAAAGNPPVDLSDLFCWEQMGGRWQAKVRAEFDIVQESFSPLNNRLLLTMMLGIRRERRQAPDFLMFHEIVETLWPETLAEPVNPPETQSRKRHVLNLIKLTRLHRLVPAKRRSALKSALRGLRH
jgi:hypothetical protein